MLELLMCLSLKGGREPQGDMCVVWGASGDVWVGWELQGICGVGGEPQTI